MKEQMPGDGRGLTSKEAAKLLFEHGENKLAQGKKISALKIFAGQFRDMMIMILLVSTVISVVMGEIVEAVAIITIVLLNAILGFIQEYRTEKTLEALKSMAAPMAKVIRDGKPQSVPAEQIVPGDLIMLKAGYKVPADAVIVDAMALQCDESLLSGESVPVEKLKGGHSQTNAPVNSVFMGTVVTKGHGTAVVTATGMSTEMGKIAGMLHEIEEGMTPLQKRLAQLGKYIAIICIIICLVVAFTGILRGEPVFDMFITGISLAVAAVPEGLPAIVTISLALAVSRILKRNSLVKRLHSVETLGCANVICTDKTGTLTENKMTVKQVYTMEHELAVSGNGYERAGEFTLDGRRAAAAASSVLSRLMEISVICNNSEIRAQQGQLPARDRTIGAPDGVWETSGEPTEIALLIMAAKANVMRDDSSYEIVDEIPFDSDRKMMTVLVRDSYGNGMSLSKGAPDVLIDRCKYVLTESGVQMMTQTHRAAIIKANEGMAAQALRVLGFAFKHSGEGGQQTQAASMHESDMVFVGLAGMIDPPRKEVYEAIKSCRQAKIRVVMITGDHKTTAEAIAKEIGIMHKGDNMVVTGAQINAMSEEEFERIAHKVSVFARVSPAHKLMIVRALKKRGDIVAMTGDGVNDAPAIKEADIGVSMGESGTDVTKQAASIILLDDNFATLVAAVEEGRVVYSNIRKVIRYLLSCNIGEVMTMFVGMLMGLPVVLLPIQILLVNLATDGLPAMALGLEPKEPDIMKQKPRQADESVFSNGLFGTILFRGCIIGLTTLAVFTAFMLKYGDTGLARTAGLLCLVLTQLFHVFECKSETRSLLNINPLDNPSLIAAALGSLALIIAVIYIPAAQFVFATVPMSFAQIVRVFGYALIAPVISTVVKSLPKRKKQDKMATLSVQN